MGISLSRGTVALRSAMASALLLVVPCLLIARDDNWGTPASSAVSPALNWTGVLLWPGAFVTFLTYNGPYIRTMIVVVSFLCLSAILYVIWTLIGSIMERYRGCP